MRIGITTFGADGGRSGIGRYLISLLAAWDATGDLADCELMGLANELPLFGDAARRMKTLRVGTHVGGPVGNILWHQLCLPGLARRRGYDVLFLPAGNRRLPMRSPCPTVGTVHDMAAAQLVGKYDRARTFYVRRVLPAMIRRLTHVITVSESSKADIVRFADVPPERITVIPLAADPRVFHPRERDHSAKYVADKFAVEGPYVLYTARIEHPGKNHVRLIRAFDRLKQSVAISHKLMLVGRDWSGAAAVHKAAAAARCSEDIVLTGFVTDGDLPVLYSAADLFVFPSLYEGFGLPVLEAMRCGVPVACADVSSLPEVAGQAARLFDPTDEGAIAAAMWDILSDAELAANYVRLGLARSGQFTWSRAGERTMATIIAAAEGDLRDD